jgi:membrane protein
MIRKFLDDGADRLGVQIAYWGFFSVFALLLVFTSILGFVFESNPAFQHHLLDSTLERMPVIGPQISGDIGSLTGSGIGPRAWLGRRVVDRAGRHARHRHRGRSRLGRAPTETSGLCQLAAARPACAGFVGAVNVLATVAVGLAIAGGVGTAVTQVLSFFASAVIDLVLFAAPFRLLTTAQITIRQVLPGAMLATGCWLALQALGGVFVTKVLAAVRRTVVSRR